MGGRLKLTIVARGGVRLWGVAPVGRRAAIKGFGEGRFSEQTTHPAGRGDQEKKDGGEEGITGYETEGARDAIPDDVKRPRELRECPQHRTEGEASGRQRERGQKIPCAVVPALGEQDEGARLFLLQLLCVELRAMTCIISVIRERLRVIRRHRHDWQRLVGKSLNDSSTSMYLT